ncbi:nuclear-pore anchor-like [Magnolia sinica]|uniref:nuclear-pore anchor-like n=1 Tax=Magnolia sinica TaxID=86752 RepID=UPI0026587F35|nr:nuclear-pore anchor-like [Magnolia sinica]
MLQYKEIAQVNELLLKQIESAHKQFKAEADKLKKSLDDEIHFLKGRVSELKSDLVSKSTEVTSAVSEKEETLSSAFAKIDRLKEENSVKTSQIVELEIQISSLKEDLEKEHICWRTSQSNYERQVYS